MVFVIKIFIRYNIIARKDRVADLVNDLFEVVY